MSDTNSIDLSYLEITFDGNKETIKVVLESFIKNTPKLTKELIECAGNQSWDKVGQLAHTIKSSFITVGAAQTGKVLGDILKESSIKNGDATNLLVNNLAEMSQQVFNEVNDKIYSYGE